MSDDNLTISFRLSAEVHALLVEEASDAGVTKHQAARILVVRALQKHDQEGLTEIAKEVLRSMAALRLSVARGSAAILGYVSPLDQKAIKRFVDERMLSDLPLDEEGAP
jgi:hypothetical protein